MSMSNVEQLKKEIPRIYNDELVLLTLPTPKQAKIKIQGAICPFHMYKLFCCRSNEDNKRAIALFKLCKIIGAIMDFVFHARKPNMIPRK